MQKIAVFGSAFNPPSLGHKNVIESLGHFDRILLVPSISHAWGKKMLDYPKRCQLLQAFVEDLAPLQVELSTIEHSLVRPGESVTTFDVLTALQDHHAESELTFVIGPDNLFHFGQFSRAEDILKKWTVMACPQRVAIRSTDIRKRIQDNLPIADFTTPSVSRLLDSEGWYSQE